MTGDSAGGALPRRSLPSDWAMLAPLLDRVLDAPPERRAKLLDEVSAGDPARRAALERLVAECEYVTPLLDRPAAERFPDLASDDDVPLPALLGGRYETGHELGRGGMARVYLARDIKHGRSVAVKVIRAELAASLGRDRFLREIEIAARLRHPNIVPLFDSGDADGTLYFVMPYEEGQSLRSRLAAEGPLPLTQAVNVLRDVARALQYAHEHGVVHRDIKPDNVMLSGGAAVVTDFGIAKAIVAAAGGDTAPGRAAAGNVPSAITALGVALGTPAYMAPEQAMGDPSSDYRADIYSFGCLAYEVLTGAPPFHDMPLHELVAAHMGTTPPPVTDRRPDVPASLGQLVGWCLAKDPAARPQSARDVLGVLEGTVKLAAPPALPSRKRQLVVRTMVAAGLVAVAGGFYLLRERNAAAVPITIAVLPFGNVSGDTATGPFADGLGDEVFASLARIPGLQMRSRSGARAYRGQLGVDATEAGRKLKVDYIVTGALREVRGRWVVSTELTRTADDADLWTDTFDRAPDQQIGVADEIARAAANVLRQRFPRALGEAPARNPSQQTKNPDAFRLYMLGQEKLRRRGQSVKESADAFREAIRLDTTYAGAYAGLSMALSLYPYFQLTPAAEVQDELTKAAQRAIQFDSTLAQPHVAMGLAAAHRYDWDAAGTEFRKALSLAPADVEAHVQYGRHLLQLGKATEALQQLQMARKEDPASPLVLSWVTNAFRLLGKKDSAFVVGAQALQGNALNYTAAISAARALLDSGFRDSARAVVGRLTIMVPPRAYIMGATGDSATAWAEIRQMNQRLPHSSSAKTTEALLWLGVGDTTRALALLEAATNEREMWPELDVVYDPMFAPVRDSPRFQRLVQRVGLPVSAIRSETRPRAR